MTQTPESLPEEDENGRKNTEEKAAQPESRAPLSKPVPRPEPTRYGDWEKDGRCIDF